MFTEFIEGFKAMENSAKYTGKIKNQFQIKYCNKHFKVIKAMEKGDPGLALEFETYVKYKMNKTGCSICQYIAQVEWGHKEYMRGGIAETRQN